MKYVLKFVREKETKNTTKFQEQPEKGKPAVIGALYVQKFAAGDATELVVTIEAEEKKAAK